MKLMNMKVIILVEDQFNDLEFWYPFYRLKEEGAAVTLVGSGRASRYNGKYGTAVNADTKADDIDSGQYHGLVIPGGYAPDIMRRYPAMVNLVREMTVSGKVVAAICHAGWMLASAGVCNDRRLTSFFAIKDDLVHAGANWVDEAVVVDGNLVTSRTPDDLPAFMRAIIEVMGAAR